jgi:tRNA(adenine34) deaminase
MDLTEAGDRPPMTRPEEQYEQWMDLALAQARLADRLDEVPIGAVVVRDGNVLAKAHNRRTLDADPTAHAELLAIQAAARALGDRRLTGCTLIVTLEPCCMCAGAALLAQVDRIVYGAADPKAGAVRTLYRLCSDQRLNHQIDIVPDIRAETSAELLREFFRRQRANGKK